MPRIKIKDLPRDTKISEEELKRIRGGALPISTTMPIPQEFVSSELNLISEWEAYQTSSSLSRRAHDVSKTMIQNLKA